MATTIIGPTTAAAYPKPVAPPLVYAKAAWSDDWQFAPELQLVHATAATAGQDLDTATIRRRYGLVKQPWQSSAAAVAAIDLTDWWVRVDVLTDAGQQTIWTGRVSGEARDVFGSDNGPAGVQNWVAYGPLQILRKVYVSRSFFKKWEADETIPDEEVELGWLQAMNDRHGDGTEPYNRSATRGDDEVYLYGVRAPWSHKDYAEYLLKKFVDESADGGPAWTLAGQVDALDDLGEVIRWRPTQSVAEMLAALISPAFGLDYRVEAVEDGFQVRVFALNDQEFSYNGHTLPRNPSTVTVRSGQTGDHLQTRLILSQDHGYKTLRVIGGRLVVCFSLRAELAPNRGEQGSSGPAEPTLEGKWNSAAETAYKYGAGALTHPLYKGAAYHDIVRQAEQFRNVYQAFGAPAKWDMASATLAPVPRKDTGEGLEDDPADYQQEVRRTLNWLPLQAGYDYTVDPPTNDSNPNKHVPEYLPPAAWIANMPAENEEQTGYQWLPVDQLGISVSAARKDWGIQLNCSPNHLVAFGDFYASASVKPTNTPPAYDYRTMACTIAIETDQRLTLEFALPGAKPSDGVLEVEAPGAEWWWLAPNTILGIDPDNPRQFLLAEPQPLRNDVDRLGIVAAGTIARYYASRARAEIVAKGLLPWSGLLGQVLSVVEEAGSTHQMHAVITAVEWQVPDGPDESPITILRAGFAQ